MKKLSIAILALITVLASCKKVPEVNLKYVDVERDLITVGTTTATVQCDYQYIATLKKSYFYYGEGENEADMNTAEMRVVQNTLYVDLADLKPNTLYSYYYEFYNGFNSMRSATKTFKTEASPVTPPEITLPSVVTAEVTEITSNSAQCGGEVTNDGGAEVIERGICWSTNANPTLNDNHIASGTGIGVFTAMMNSLEANTTYHVRAYATNEKGAAYGLDKEFTTASIVVLPTVITAEITEITSNSAQCGGEVTNDGGAEVTERGICWSTNVDPTLNDSYITSGTGMGAFTAMMNGLEANTTYHVRAYAINEIGMAYGLDREFTTLGGAGNAPIGAINGLFTINSSGNQVYFSQGNLQYQASTNTWRFAENQWDFVGNSTLGTVYENEMKCNNSSISSTYSGWIDLFGWGTSGYDHGAVCYQPWSTSNTPWDYYAYGYRNYSLYDSTGMADWGFNAISNGGNTINSWRTLTIGEWEYIINSRNTESGIRYTKAIVNDIRGVILFPDDWNSEFVLYSVNQPDGVFTDNNIASVDWVNIFESKGAIFLPITGFRRVYYTGMEDICYGAYHSSTVYYTTEAYTPIVYFLMFQYQSFGVSWYSRSDGFSVRLVQDANP